MPVYRCACRGDNGQRRRVWRGVCNGELVYSRLPLPRLLATSARSPVLTARYARAGTPPLLRASPSPTPAAPAHACLCLASLPATGLLPAFSAFNL